jgi:hypothetical protein
MVSSTDEDGVSKPVMRFESASSGNEGAAAPDALWDPHEVHSSPEGWILLPVDDEIVQQAQQIRARRDAQYTNIFREVDTDLRWVGEIGELCFYFWLREHAPGNGRWIRDQAAGKPDFIIHGQPIGMKTVKRKVAFRPDYTAQITARHAEEPVDHFFFASYEQPRQRLWLLGGITRSDFLKHARYYAAGEQVHEHYTVRDGHEIYNIAAKYLTPPLAWLTILRESAWTRPSDSVG